MYYFPVFFRNCWCFAFAEKAKVSESNFSMDTGKIVNLKKSYNDLELQWEIKDYFSLCEQFYYSPTIYFSDALWYLCIFPSGQRLSKEYVAILLRRHDSGPAKRVNVNIFLKTKVQSRKWWILRNRSEKVLLRHGVLINVAS